MVPTAFDFHRASTVDEAIELLGRLPEAKLLAGGHSLIPMMKLRLASPGALVDIARIRELSGICRDGDVVVVGALTRHAEIAASPDLAAACPLLAEAAGKIGDPAVRNRGTLGGNIAHADPASDLPAVLVAVGATIHLAGPDGRRQVPASEFFVGLLTTALGAREVITRVDLPVSPAGTGQAYLKHEHPASGYAVVGAAASVTVQGGRCTRASLAFNGISAVPHRAAEVVDGLVGSGLDDATLAAAASRLRVADPLGDLHASGEYRIELARVYARRALAAARDRAAG